MPTPFEKIRDEFLARCERLHYETPRERRHKAWQEWAAEALTVCARAFVLHGDRSHKDRAVMTAMWDWERFRWRFPPSKDQFTAIGGIRAVYRRIGEGNLGIDGMIGIWNGGFFKGLQLSGALRRYRDRTWYIWENSHRDLVADMEVMPVFHRFERVSGRNGIKRLRRCPAAFLPAEPPDGASVVAGLFAGSVLRRVDDEDWLEMPGTDDVIRLLDAWRILHRPGRVFRRRATILVPPFYAMLFVDITPDRAMARLLALRRPALCPLLPAILWDLTLRERHLPVIPFKGALPYSCSMRTFRRRGWKRRDLHLTGIRMGIINGVDPRFRDRMAAWYDAQVKLRAARKSMATVAVPPIVAVQGNDRGPALDGPQPEILASEPSK